MKLILTIITLLVYPTMASIEYCGDGTHNYEVKNYGYSVGCFVDGVYKTSREDYTNARSVCKSLCKAKARPVCISETPSTGTFKSYSSSYPTYSDGSTKYIGGSVMYKGYTKWNTEYIGYKCDSYSGLCYTETAYNLNKLTCDISKIYTGGCESYTIEYSNCEYRSKDYIKSYTQKKYDDCNDVGECNVYRTDGTLKFSGFLVNDKLTGYCYTKNGMNTTKRTNTVKTCK